MSDRIKKLAQKAELLERNYSFGQYWEGELTEQQKEFARLIILECARIADHTDLQDPVPSEAIKRYFKID